MSTNFRHAASAWGPYVVGFLLLLVFFGPVYGDVLVRAQQESYVATDATAMFSLLTKPCGHLFWAGRFLLLVYHWAWLGALVMAAALTLSAFWLDRACGLQCSAKRAAWRGVGHVPSAVLMGWMLLRGTNLYYKNEPSLFILLALALLLASAITACVAALVRRSMKKAEAQVAPKRRLPFGALLATVLFGACIATAIYYNENVVLTARLQLLQQKGEWQEMIDEARAARRPSRAVAAYHAIALEETDQLLSGLFDIAYDYPKLHLDSIDGSEEYGLFVADCNYHAGLLNAAYRKAMDHIVMNGACLYALKRLAVCAVANEEWNLARRYLTVIGRMPFEGDFVEKYEAIVNQPALAADDAELAHVKSLYPVEQRFEQFYREPAFLGYNIGLLQGTDATLFTSVAACLYSKELMAAAQRLQFLVQKGFALPMSVQEAIAIISLKQPEVLQAFPQVGQFVQQQLRSFLLAAKPYANDREALRREMKENWLGTYFYYYYCENNDPDQVVKPDAKQKAGVN